MELIKQGHEVTVITTDPQFKNDTAPKNLREIDVHDISYMVMKDFTLTVTGSDDDLTNQIIAVTKDIQQYLDASQNGVIYFSFGTNVLPSSLSQEKIKIFENVFSQLPYNVIWKWDSDEKSVKSKNIKKYKWLPQSDLLRHPNVKLFITQGGLQSTDESITAGVPLIGIPMLGDQWYNAEKYVHHKIGIKLSLEKLTENQLKNAIIEIIEDKSYRENIIRLRSLMQDQPQAPLNRAVWWIEYVLRHGGAKHLRSPAANMSWIEYYELELVFILLSSILIFIGLITFLIKFSISCASKYVKEKLS
ncbi:unnamed protein product [Parnassius apollo]|uniref:UDP-glucuronosyltransferase n=1 Tax=Parnassius apollo TaxID=110799 RepID=A0A8S3XQC3_PARAO|nr:unnamed protein product [Parnassius apollo]